MEYMSQEAYQLIAIYWDLAETDIGKRFPYEIIAKWAAAQRELRDRGLISETRPSKSGNHWRLTKLGHAFCLCVQPKRVLP